MNDVLRKYGIPVGIVIAAIVAIYFYGRARYDSGRQDLRTELLLQKPQIDTVIKHDTIPILGEGVGRPLFDRKWTKMSTQLDIDNIEDTPTLIPIYRDSCEDLKIPYVVEVREKDVYGEIVCKPESQSAKWDLKVIRSESEVTSTKFIEEQLSFWLTPIMSLNSNGTGVGGMIGYKSIGIGIMYDGSPTYLIGLHLDF